MATQTILSQDALTARSRAVWSAADFLPIARSFAPGAEAFISRLGLAPGERLLDVACGTGVVARQAAPRVAPGGQVCGLDLNDAMLDVARGAAADAEPAIEWLQGDAAAMPLPDAAFDVVVCQAALMFMPDPRAALAEMRRVLAPGGRLGLSVFRDGRFNPLYAAFAELLERHVGADAGTMMRSPFATWGVADVRALLADAGLREVHVRIVCGGERYPSAAEMLRREAASSPLAARLGDLDAAVRGALVRDLEDALAEHTDDDGVVVPFQALAAFGRRV
jgi:ubiquinone/menaquinone biosynthesis C-methylase UbiE